MTLQSGGSFGLGPSHSQSAFNCKTPLGTFYANCKLDALYQKALSETNPKAIAATYAQAGKILNTDIPYATLWVTANLDAYTNKLGGSFKIFSNDRDSLFDIQHWTISN